MKPRFSVMSIICLLLLFAGVISAAAADTAVMTAGEIISGFVPAGTGVESSDSAVAWVDEGGNLKALRSGTAELTIAADSGPETRTVTVNPYSDGSEIVGQLKILARYNDSMQFYDGHVYLLFTSYQDGVSITVPDLYGGYEISDRYYEEIKDISNGSNHTGTNTGKYFTFNKEMETVTLNRGEIVTIGMYRGFDLSVAQAALGTVMNSSAWKSLENAGKGAIIKTIFDFLDSGFISAEEALVRLMAVMNEIDLDVNSLMDGVVEGGVCFNRELYNQKLEWDQFENVTYELDITRNQLNTMVRYLAGNLNNFSILKNSCATVALRAWNAAVGMRGEDPTAYYLTPTGEGIYAIVDAPKGVRDDIVKNLKGYYLNNAEGVAEPNAGFQDETGWVYVSAPEIVAPVDLIYEENDTIRIDETRSKPASIITAAKGDTQVSYNKEEQDIPVTVTKSVKGPSATISSIDFDINGNVISVDSGTILEDGIWIKAKIFNIQEGEEYYVTDADGNALPSDYADEWISFHANAIPVSFTVVASSKGTHNILKTTVINGEDLKAATKAEVYVKENGTERVLGDFEELTSGTRFYVKPVVDPEENSFALYDITLNGTSIMVDENYDAEEGAYTAEMPAGYSKLDLIYQPAVVYNTKGNNIIQASTGDILTASYFAEARFGSEAEKALGPENVRWKFIDNEEGALEFSDNTHKNLKVLREGEAIIFAGVDSNDNIGVWFTVKVYPADSDMVKISFNDGDYELLAQAPGKEEKEPVPYSGYLVKKGTELFVVPTQTENRVISDISLFTDSSGEEISLYPGSRIAAYEDTTIKVSFLNAVITGVPDTVRLAKKSDSYQLNAAVQYSDPQYKDTPVYFKGIRYESGDPLVAVDETGKITVTGDVPAEGKAVIVTAYADSSNDKVFAVCKVILGNYSGEKIVGRLTIHARPIYRGELVAHSSATFTAYEDMDLDISFYNYFKPTEKFISLMRDYKSYPEKYSSDPALYNNDELELGPTEVREREYFDKIHNGAGSEPSKVSLKCGDSITLSNYGYDRTNIETIRGSLQNSKISDSVNAQALVAEMTKYINGEEMDGTIAFDSLFATLVEIYTITQQTGANPADGHTEGGLDVNKEPYNQFRTNNSQLPNNYYQVEITADELAYMQSYLGNPENNYYSLFVKNCATGAVDIWNTTLADRPELHLTANFTGFGMDPESLYIELGLMKLKQGLDGEAGENFYPRVVGSSSHCPNPPEPTPPEPRPADPDGPRFYRLCTDCLLPGTGFSAAHNAPLSAQPKDLSYNPVQMRIQIPTLNVEAELVTVPLADNTWQVEWLGDRAGLLSGSELPGEGLSIVAAHNTLNDTAFGPFALLNTLELNDSILVTGKRNKSMIFRVYANELLNADGMEELLKIAGDTENTLALVTCENEAVDGGYLNRRVIFAKPVGEL